ncbi:MAG: hypothetical protein JRI85_17725, partial [Deltaproteobacteria bacterium]|nr:hypothetical protein [Deltaproteobacteria bacterium]
DRPESIKEYLNGLNSPRKAFHGLAGNYYFESDGRGVKPVFIVKAAPSLLNWLP